MGVVVVRSGIIRSSFETIVVVVALSTLLFDFALLAKIYARFGQRIHDEPNGENNDMVGNGGALIINP